ncbi:hypothetical protein RBSH_00313 [Rhodopirellula baltica SH28]|uniref:Uncharacterized protein n=1 Tax=Rhodopirellula baltica SH28 TaxID=993517 RepID=K5DNI5_RHOBT|nr:hypothetical protein RBSH_00313 [Rhodopirellula baltica SH28]
MPDEREWQIYGTDPIFQRLLPNNGSGVDWRSVILQSPIGKLAANWC